MSGSTWKFAEEDKTIDFDCSPSLQRSDHAITGITEFESFPLGLAFANQVFSGKIAQASISGGVVDAGEDGQLYQIKITFVTNIDPVVTEYFNFVVLPDSF